MVKVLFIFLLMFVGCVPSIARNVTLEEEAQVIEDQAKILQYQQLLQQKEQEAYLERTQKPAFTFEVNEFVVASSDIDSGPSFMISEIVVTGNTVLTQRRLDLVTSEYLNRLLSLSEVIQLSKHLTNLYMSRGFVTTRVVVPPQNLQAGVLVLQVVEGRIASIIIDGKPDTRQAKRLFPNVVGRVLNIRELEQGVDQFNRLRSMAPQMAIVAANKPGYSHVVIKLNQKDKKQWATLQANTGAFGANDFRPSTGFVLENVVGLLESWYVNFYDEGRFESNNSQTRVVSLSLPYGGWTFNSSYNRSGYLNRVEGRVRVIDNTGNTETTSFGLSRIINRTQRSKTAVGLSYVASDTVSRIEDVVNDASSFKVVSMLYSLSHSFSTSWGQFSGSFSFKEGKDWHGAMKDDVTLDNTYPRSLYQKWMLDVSYATSFLIKQNAWRYSASLRTQHSKDVLYASEKMLVGGIFSVRGTSESLSGDDGATFSQTLSIPLSTFGKSHWLSMNSLSLGLDVGYVFTRDVYASYERGGAMGASLGLKGGKESMFWGASVGWPLKVSSFLDKGDSRLAANVGFEF